MITAHHSFTVYLTVLHKNLHKHNYYVMHKVAEEKADNHSYEHLGGPSSLN